MSFMSLANLAHWEGPTTEWTLYFGAHIFGIEGYGGESILWYGIGYQTLPFPAGVVLFGILAILTLCVVVCGFGWRAFRLGVRDEVNDSGRGGDL